MTKDPLGRDLIDLLSKDPRVIKAEGRLISRAGRILKTMKMSNCAAYKTISYLWRAEVGLPQTTPDERDYPFPIYYGGKP